MTVLTWVCFAVVATVLSTTSADTLRKDNYEFTKNFKSLSSISEVERHDRLKRELWPDTQESRSFGDSPPKSFGEKQRFCTLFGCDCTPKPGRKCCDGYIFDPKTKTCREIYVSSYQDQPMGAIWPETQESRSFGDSPTNHFGEKQRFCTPKPGRRCCDGYKFDPKTQTCREIYVSPYQDQPMSDMRPETQESRSFGDSPPKPFGEKQRFCTPKPGRRCCDGYKFDPKSQTCREIYVSPYQDQEDVIWPETQESRSLGRQK